VQEENNGCEEAPFSFFYIQHQLYFNAQPLQKNWYYKNSKYIINA